MSQTIARLTGLQRGLNSGSVVGIDADKAAIESVAQTNGPNLADGEARGVRRSLAPRVEQEGAIGHRTLTKKHASMHRAECITCPAPNWVRFQVAKLHRKAAIC